MFKTLNLFCVRLTELNSQMVNWKIINWTPFFGVFLFSSFCCVFSNIVNKTLSWRNYSLNRKSKLKEQWTVGQQWFFEAMTVDREEPRSTVEGLLAADPESFSRSSRIDGIFLVHAKSRHFHNVSSTVSWFTLYMETTIGRELLFDYWGVREDSKRNEMAPTTNNRLPWICLVLPFFFLSVIFKFLFFNF